MRCVVVGCLVLLGCGGRAIDDTPGGAGSPSATAGQSAGGASPSAGAGGASPSGGSPGVAGSTIQSSCNGYCQAVRVGGCADSFGGDCESECASELMTPEACQAAAMALIDCLRPIYAQLGACEPLVQQGLDRCARPLTAYTDCRDGIPTAPACVSSGSGDAMSCKLDAKCLDGGVAYSVSCKYSGPDEAYCISTSTSGTCSGPFPSNGSTACYLFARACGYPGDSQAPSR